MKVVISWKCETARSDRWCAPLHLRKLIMFRMTMMIRRMIRMTMMMPLKIWRWSGCFQSKDEGGNQEAVSQCFLGSPIRAVDWMRFSISLIWSDRLMIRYGLMMRKSDSGRRSVATPCLQFDEVFHLHNSLIMMMLNEICSNQIWKKWGSCQSDLSRIVAITAPGGRSDEVFHLCDSLMMIVSVWTDKIGGKWSFLSIWGDLQSSFGLCECLGQVLAQVHSCSGVNGTTPSY